MGAILEPAKAAVSLEPDRKETQVEVSGMYALYAITSTKVVLVLDVDPKCKGLTFR